MRCKGRVIQKSFHLGKATSKVLVKLSVVSKRPEVVVLHIVGAVVSGVLGFGSDGRSTSPNNRHRHLHCARPSSRDVRQTRGQQGPIEATLKRLKIMQSRCTEVNDSH